MVCLTLSGYSVRSCEACELLQIVSEEDAVGRPSALDTAPSPVDKINSSQRCALQGISSVLCTREVMNMVILWRFPSLSLSCYLTEQFKIVAVASKQTSQQSGNVQGFSSPPPNRLSSSLPKFPHGDPRSSPQKQDPVARWKPLRVRHLRMI